MRRTRLWLAGALLASGSALALTRPSAATTPRPAQGAPAPVAFVDVTVVPMDRERLIARQTVMVRDGKIAAMGPTASTRVPAGATRVDGRGKFLMPGLAEMHAHVLPAQAPGNADERINKDIFFLYIANGITTIRAMLGAPNQLALRTQTASGALLGPTIYVAAPSLNGNSAPNPETAAGLVRAHKAAGYDLLKLHPGLKRDVYDAIVRTANEAGITWGGHVSAEVGLEHTLNTKQSTIDHLDGYLEASVSGQPQSWADFVSKVDDAALKRWAGRTRAAGVWNVPTEYLFENIYTPLSADTMLALPEMRYATANWKNGWRNQKQQQLQQQAAQGATPAAAARFAQARRLVLKALADSGAKLLMGTDSPQMFNVPGFALHREMGVMAAAGLTPYQIYASGSANVARYAKEDLKAEANFGTVAVGNRADLVLLDANPLADVANLTRRSGVMVRGRWVPRAEIDAGLEEIANRNK